MFFFQDAELLSTEGDSNPASDYLTVQPPNIKFGTMRKYQIEGLNWMIRLYNTGVSGILADEMGLGKTLQSISMLAFLKQFKGVNGKHIVSCIFLLISIARFTTLPILLRLEFLRFITCFSFLSRVSGGCPVVNAG